MEIAAPVRGTIKVRFLTEWTEYFRGDPEKHSVWIDRDVVIDLDREWAERLLAMEVVERA